MSLHFESVGADAARTLFSKITKETLAHAYLFTGPPGVGKKHFAQRLAQSLLCLAPHPGGVLGYDGTCASCKLFEQSDNTRHPDFLEHVGPMKIGDPGEASGFYEGEDLSARNILRLLSLESYSGGLRILLLGDIEFASPAAANALLKFLEEPPSGAVAILTSSAPGRLLPTIRSRLVEVHFRALSAEQVRQVLVDMEYSAKDAKAGASLGHGSVTRAIGALGGDDESLRDTVASWFFAAVRGKTPEEVWATRETLDEGLETVKMLARDWVASGVAAGSNLMAADYSKELRTLPKLEADDAVAVLAKIDEAQRMARTNVMPGMVSEFLRLTLTGKGRSSKN